MRRAFVKPVSANLVLVQGDELRLHAMHGAPAAFAEAVQLNTAVPRQTPVGRVFETKQSVHIDDVQVDEAYRHTRLARLAGARTTLGVPMLKDEQIIGLFSSTAKRYGRSPTSRSSWSRTLLRRPSSPSRTRACSRSCATSLNLSSSRPPPPTCSRSSAARLLI